MKDASGPYGRITQREPDVAEVHILWMTAGLGCDGDTVCGQSAASVRASRAECTCTWGMARRSRRVTRPCTERNRNSS